MPKPILTHEQKVESLLAIIATASVSSFAFHASQIPPSNVTVKDNAINTAIELAGNLERIIG